MINATNMSNSVISATQQNYLNANIDSMLCGRNFALLLCGTEFNSRYSIELDPSCAAREEGSSKGHVQMECK